MEPKKLRLAALLLAALAAGCAGGRASFFRPDPLEHQQKLFAEGKYAQIIAELGKSQITGLPRRQRARAYIMLARSYEFTGADDRALQTYQLAVGLYPKNLELLTHLGGLLHQAGLDDRARPHFERVVSLHPNNAAANLGLAEIHRAQGFLAKSREHYEKTLEEWAKNAALWRDYAGLLSEQRNFVLARTAIQISLDLTGDSVETYLAYARIERRHGLNDSAYRRLEKALAIDPADIELNLQKALWMLKDGRIEKARKLAERMIEKFPEEPLAHWIRASTSLRMGKHAWAAADLRAAASAERTHPFIARTARAMLLEMGEFQ
ncbi:MAG: tetratricopeptide repeat protein [Elusimicrobiota bacterium]